MYSSRRWFRAILSSSARSLCTRASAPAAIPKPNAKGGSGLVLPAAALAIATAGGAAGTYYLHTHYDASASAMARTGSYTDGLKRSLVFWAQAFPIYLEYKTVEWWFSQADSLTPEEQSAGLGEDTGDSAGADAWFNWLHERHAPTVEQLCLTLKGFYLKGAQVASTRDDLLPEQYLQFCKSFQDNVPSEFKSEEECSQTVCEALGIEELSQVFSHFDPQPIGSASIGAVHRARLLDGKEVAVKLQFKGIENRFRDDIATIKRFCAFALPSHLPFLNEIERQFLTEFDYIREAENLEQVRAHWSDSTKDCKWLRKRVKIPQPVKDLCRKNVMVMEYLDGENLLKKVVRQYEAYAEKRGITIQELAEQEATREKSKSKEAIKMWFARGITRGLDLARNAPTFTYNIAARVFVGKGSARPYVWSELPIDLNNVIEILMHVHALQIFRQGVFNADPHPGNILLLRDGSIGLVDYGQVKRLDLEKRLRYAKLIMLLAEGDKSSVVDHATKEMRFRTKCMNSDMIYRHIAFFNDRDTPDITGKRNVHQFMDWANKVDPIISMDDDYIMCGRVAMLLRSLGNAFGMKLCISQYWKQEARKLLRENQHQHQQQQNQSFVPVA